MLPEEFAIPGNKMVNITVGSNGKVIHFLSFVFDNGRANHTLTFGKPNSKLVWFTLDLTDIKLRSFTQQFYKSTAADQPWYLQNIQINDQWVCDPEKIQIKPEKLLKRWQASE
jgi:hypothetical protein